LPRLPWLAALALASAPLAAQNAVPPRAMPHDAAPPNDSTLGAITARGRALAAYDAAAWHASDALMALTAAPQGVTGYVVRQAEAGWVVAFGRLSDDRSSFVVAYEARPGADSSRNAGYTATALSPPLADTGYYARAARAIDTARAAFGAVQRPYNVAALPAPGGEWWVYLVPAPTVAGVWPLGGDARYRVSADGRRVLERRQLHRAVIEFGAEPAPAGGRVEAGTHVAVLDDVPEDTDVFHVLTRTPKVPQYVVTNAFVYNIATDGTIRLLGRREAVLGK
jgi:hypothetical protein